MAFSKVTLNGETLMDVTNDTVDSNNMLYGTRGTAANGTTVTGAVVTTPVDSTLDTTSHNAIENAAVATALNSKIETYYGTCSTAKATAQKEVSISNITSITTGLTVYVKFTNSNTAETPTLKINTLDPVAIKRYGTTAPSTSAASSWNAGAVIALTYDGTNFIMNDWINTTYSAMTTDEMQAGTSTTSRLITPARLKAAVEYHAPVTSVNGVTGAVSITIPSKVSDLTNDSGFISTESDPVFGASAASTITSSNISDWNTKTSVVAYTATLATASWSNTTPSTYTYSNASLTCGANGTVPPIVTCTSNEAEYSTISSASATPGTGITFTAPSAPTSTIGLIIIDYK